MNFLLFIIATRGASSSAYLSAGDFNSWLRSSSSASDNCWFGLWYLVMVQSPNSQRQIQIVFSCLIIAGTLVATSAKNILSYPKLVWTNTGLASFGLHKCFEMIPKKKPPKPNPQITNPETAPFLPGKWLIADCKAVEYIRPLPIPNAML